MTTFRSLPALIVACTVWLGGSEARAVLPDEMLSDPALEARARTLSAELRCLVCQNQAIDDSNAPLARDLRLLLRERLAAGDSDDQAMTYLVSRYGNFIRLRPPFDLKTAALWLGPALVLILSAGLYLAYLRRGHTPTEPPPAPLTEAERRQIAALTGESP